MNPRDFFPLGRAQGKAFCNRQTETDWLTGNILAGKHSLLIAPRRFGKSSLADIAVAKSNLPMVNLNFNTCADEHDVEQLIRDGTGELIGKALGTTEKIIAAIKNYATTLTPKVSFGTKYARLELTSNKQIAAASNVEESLLLMEKLLAEKKKRAVILFDEFQTVGLIAKGKGVEAAIRNVAQDTKYLSIIFSGSNRSLVMTMFEDETRPLYKLCRKLSLKRIEKTHYKKHLNKAAQLAWKSNLDDTVFEHIMLLSERHPYYVNYLCDVIWTECKKTPTVSDVDHAWHIVLEEETSDANAEIATLSLGQKKILRFIANDGTDGLTSASTVNATGMAQSSIAGAITGLLDKDFIEKEQDRYEIISPVIKHFLREGTLSS